MFKLWMGTEIFLQGHEYSEIFGRELSYMSYLSKQDRTAGGLLSSEYGTYKTPKAKLRPSLQSEHFTGRKHSTTSQSHRSREQESQTNNNPTWERERWSAHCISPRFPSPNASRHRLSLNPKPTTPQDSGWGAVLQIAEAGSSQRIKRGGVRKPGPPTTRSSLPQSNSWRGPQPPPPSSNLHIHTPSLTHTTHTLTHTQNKQPRTHKYS